MLPDTLPVIPSKPVAPGMPLVKENPGKSATSDNSATTEQSGFFTVLLNQLTIETPAAGPVVPTAGETFAPTPAETIDATLPLTGNALPLPLPEPETAAPAESAAAARTRANTDLLTGLPAVAATRPEQAGRHAPVAAPTPLAAGPVAEAPSPLPEPVLGGRDAERPATPQPVRSTAPTDVEPGLRLTQPAPAPDIAPVATAPARTAPGAKPDVPDFIPAATAAAPESTIVTATATPAGTHSTAATATPQTLTLHHPVADPRWSESLGQRIVWMGDNGIGRAEIRLNPPELGPLEVRIAMNNDDARVTFTVQHGVTRDAVEAALPRLREMFAAQGINLADASVSQHSSGGRGETAAGDNSSGSTTRVSDAPGMDEREDNTAYRGNAPRGLIDTYV